MTKKNPFLGKNPGNSALFGFEDWENDPKCELCGLNFALERHHKVYRSRLGSDRPQNLALICKVCHGAAHGISVNLSGHCCQTCPVLAKDGCYFGERLLGREAKTPPPWDDREEA